MGLTPLSAQGLTDYITVRNAYDTEQNDVVVLSDPSVAEDGGGFFLNVNSKKVRYAKVEIIYGREDKTDVAGDDWTYDLAVDIMAGNQLLGTPNLRVETGDQAKYSSSFRILIGNI